MLQNTPPASSAKAFTLHLPGHPDQTFTTANSLSEAYGLGCAGANLSPELRWENPPEGTRSFVLTVHDADAPTFIGWTHWVMVNLPADARSLPEGASRRAELLPPGALETRTDFGAPGYGGPCPPEGREHRYTFTLTALKIDSLPVFVTADSMPAMVSFLAGANALGEAKAVLRYAR